MFDFSDKLHKDKLGKKDRVKSEPRECIIPIKETNIFSSGDLQTGL